MTDVCKRYDSDCLEETRIDDSESRLGAFEIQRKSRTFNKDRENNDTHTECYFVSFAFLIRWCTIIVTYLTKARADALLSLSMSR